jgi:predicted RNA-binding Zn-ribbon protein involved in translation (DUF1610 family)
LKDKFFCHDCGWSGDEPNWKEFVDWVPYGSGDIPMVTAEPRCPSCGKVNVEESEETKAAFADDDTILNRMGLL